MNLIQYVIIGFLTFTNAWNFVNSYARIDRNYNLLDLKSTCTDEALLHLRTLMNDENIQAYIVPHTDAHQSEYIADEHKRLEYISKFTGSAGYGIVTKDQAALWTDSRYHIQAENQLDLNCWILMKTGLSNVSNSTEWMIEVLPTNSTVGVDPLLLTATEFDLSRNHLEKNEQKLIGIHKNLIDEIWFNRPVPSKSEIIPLSIKYSGKTSGSKISEVMEKVKEKDAELIIITSLDEIAWLTNLRGADINYNPLFFSYAILYEKTLHLFVNKDQFGIQAQNQVESETDDFVIHDYDTILSVLNSFINNTTGKIITSTNVNQAIFEVIPINRLIRENIVANLKCIKNPTEAKNMEEAHIRDGYALIQYLHWLNATIDYENITELSGADKLTRFRTQQENFRGISFEPISAVGENAALPHYSPTLETDLQITRNKIYLIDSGGHYWDGTTDVTRTVHFGIPRQEEKSSYTLVLKGFIGFTTSIYPKTTQISYLDYMARRSLWQAGLNYGHGTGHGVGMYLPVHEYPPLVSSKGAYPFQQNIFTSNEPGLYLENKFGIRIEDVVQVIECDILDAFDGDGCLTFRSITYAPLQTKLMNFDLLTKDEITFINSYNTRVKDTIGPILLKHKQMAAYQWLLKETLNISDLIN